MGVITRGTPEENHKWFQENLGAGGMVFRKPQPKDLTSSSPQQKSETELMDEFTLQLFQEAKEQMSASEPKTNSNLKDDKEGGCL
jgi:hypothetical protein